VRAPVIHAGPVWGPRLQTVLVLSGSMVVAALAGTEVAAGAPDRISTPVLGLAALAGAIVLFSIQPEKLFLGWLFLAPLFQNSADASSLGKPFVFAFYLAPAAVLIAHTALGWRADRRIRPVDTLPALFVLYVFASLAFTTSLLHDDPLGATKAFFTTTAVGAIVYYFVVFGPGSRIRAIEVVRVLLVAALLQSVFSLIDWRTGWNLWGDTSWQEGGLSRTVSTLNNPAVLGVFIGTGIVLAFTVLAWDGPRSLRRLAWFVILLGAPAIMVTLTRAPIIATALVSFVVVLVGRRGRVPALVAIAAVGVVLVAVWPTLTSSRLYEERIANRGTVETRAEVQRVSLQLAAKRPLTGHGYGSFDEVKNTVGRTLGVSATALGNTSHNGYLTLLVEYGVFGLALLMLPWGVIVARAISRARWPAPDRWFAVGCIASIAVFCLSATANDFRFFSFIQALPWLFVGFARRTLDEGSSRSTS
jgi:O-antigen ligase